MRRSLPILLALCLLPSALAADEHPKTWVVTISAQNFPGFPQTTSCGSVIGMLRNSPCGCGRETGFPPVSCCS
jgi:hypothetical protein